MEKKKAHNRVDMIGKTYNSWKVLEHSHTNGKIPYYKCECLECNTEHVVDGRNIRSGLSKRCKDCGKKHTYEKQRGTVRTKKTSKEVAEYYLMNGKKKGAFKRGKEWSLTREQFVELIYKPCNYCGTEPLTKVNPTKGHSLAPSRATECFITYNGIDRVDSSKGYTVDNVVTCCEFCNRAKMTMSTEAFATWLERAYKHLTK